MNSNGNRLLGEVIKELNKATSNYGEYHSPHEGYAIIKEELEKLWNEIKKSPKNRNYKLMEKEAIQLTAMSLRFLNDMEFMNLTCLRDKSKNGE